MNTSRSDETDSTIDIFVLSVSETVVPLLPEHLEKKGYQVTRFTDGKNLLKALKPEKPNLLICDTTTLDKEAFEVCRRIKADDDLWVIPVLILTNVSKLSDLFDVLDCNADNFLPLPFDLPFGLSVIESMLGTPVERQIPDQIKTQFKIRHDDRIYIVAANRRKLLELLLSSFEIAVNTSSALSHVKTDLQTLSESGKYLEDRVTDQTRLIDTIQATLHQKEQKILTLTSEIEEKQKLLAQKTRKALIVTDDGNSQTLFFDKEGIETSSFSEINMLRQKISELFHEVDTTKTSLDAVQEELEEEKMHCTSLECTLELLDQQKELAEKSFRSITDEHKQLISAFAAERDRVVSAEREILTVMQAKTQSEQEMTLIINDLNEREEHQAADLIRLKSELEREVTRRVSAENQVGSLCLEKEKMESLLRLTANGLKDQLDDLRLQLESTRTALENEENTTKLLKGNLAEIVAEHEKTELRVKEDLESDKATVIKLKRDLDEATAIQNTLKMDIDALTIQNKAVVDELNQANQSRTQSDQQVGLLADELKKVQTAFDNERKLHQADDKSSDALMQTVQRTEQDLRISFEEQNKQKELLENERKLRVTAEDKSQTAHEEREHLKQELRAVTEEQVRQENDCVLKIQNLEEELELIRNQKKSLEKQVNVLTNERTPAEQTVKDFTDEPDRAKNAIGEKGVDHLTRDDAFVSVGEEFQVRKQFFLIEETPVREKENVQDGIVNKANFPVIGESPSQVFAEVTMPDTQKSPGSEKKLTSSKPSSQNPELSPKAVTDIVNTFSDDDLFEEN
jgi:DNA-binding response OmpR family regulator